jgi:hypothetical protein
MHINYIMAIRKRKDWLRLILKGIAVFIVCWMLLIVVAYLYISTNKDKIAEGIRTDLNKKINGTISFGNLEFDLFHNFPSVSIDVSDLHVRDSAFAKHGKELLQVKHVYMGFGFYDLLAGKRQPEKITLKDGTAYLYADTSGYANWKILKEATDTSSGAKKKTLLEKISLVNMHVIFQDEKKFKYYSIIFKDTKCKIDNRDSSMVLYLNDRAFIEKAAFNTRKGSYLANKTWEDDLKIYYNKLSKKISINNEWIRIGQQPFKVNGVFSLDSTNPVFSLTIDTKKIAIEEAASLFPPVPSAKLAQFHMSRGLENVHAELSGLMKFQQVPLSIVNFELHDATVEVGGNKFNHTSFKGRFSNETDPSKARDDGNSNIKLTGFRTGWQKFNLESHQLAVFNLLDPYLKLDLTAKFALKDVDEIIASRKIDFNGGRGEATVNYAGPLDRRKDTTTDLDGSVKVFDGDIQYLPRNFHFANTNIDLLFKHGDMYVRKMNTEINGNAFEMSGEVNRFMSMFNSDPSKAIFNWNVYSPHLDLVSLQTSMRRNANAKAISKKPFFEKLDNKLDRFFDALNSYVRVRVDKLVYKNFVAENVHGNLAVTSDKVNLQDFSFTHASGSVLVNASMVDNGKGNNLTLISKMNNVDVKQLFAAFNNFGMQSLSSKNLQGRFSADINLTSVLDGDNNLATGYNKGTVDFSLKNGRLYNFGPLVEIDNNFLKKRNMSDISFAELKDKLELRGNEIYVNKMEIQSSAVGMFVEGLYSFQNKTDMTIQIPFKYMKKHDDGFVPENKGIDTKTGMGIFLRGKDVDGKIKFSYDPFARLRKE